MDKSQQDRYQRWQDYRISHLSFSINLFLGFAVASLAYVINLKIENKVTAVVLLDKSVYWWTACAAFGCVATVAKLLDYRYTARKIKDGGGFNTFMAKWCGHVTWGCFWIQVITYPVGGYQFIRSVLTG